jgi:adenylate kinase family enzyme
MKVAVFGKPGGGKSTLGRQIALVTSLPLYQLDLIQFKKGGARVPDDELARLHADILGRPRWVLDGFGTVQTFEAMLREASVLVYVERVAWVHYWWVTKRFLVSPFSRPLGWPEGSPMLRSTISCYQYLKLSPQFWTADFKSRLMAQRPAKRVYVIRRRSDEVALLNDLRDLATTADEALVPL